MIIGERLKGFLKHHGISAKSFAEMVGVTEGMVYKYYKMENVDSQTIEKWAKTLYVPIMTFMDDRMYERATHVMTAEELKNAEEYFNENKEYIHFQNRRILGDLANAPKDVVLAEFEKVKYEMEQRKNEFNQENSISESEPQISHTAGVPYYNVDFIGGFDMVMNDQTINPDYLIDFKKYNEADCWCNVTGHSMEPEITHGDIIAMKKIEDFSFLPLGEVYAIVTTNGMRTIKRLGPSSNPNSYSLVPTNKSPEYGIQELPKKMISIVYQVLGCMKRL